MEIKPSLINSIPLNLQLNKPCINTSLWNNPLSRLFHSVCNFTQRFLPKKAPPSVMTFNSSHIDSLLPAVLKPSQLFPTLYMSLWMQDEDPNHVKVFATSEGSIGYGDGRQSPRGAKDDPMWGYQNTIKEFSQEEERSPDLSIAVDFKKKKTEISFSSKVPESTVDLCKMIIIKSLNYESE